MSLQIQSSFQTKEEIWNVILTGEVDVSTAPKFRSTLNDLYSQKQCDVVMDLAQLGYIDSTGLGVMIGVLGRMQENNHRISVINPKEHIQKLFRITGFDKILLKEKSND